MTDELSYDVAIIGGGLAGLSLAIQCAGENYKVVLYEKETYPFHKVCGEYISFESYDFLQSLGVDFQSLRLPVIKKLELSDNKGRSYLFNLPLGGFGISRYSLDFSLYKIALSKGVNVCTNTKVRDVEFNNEVFTVTASNKQIHAKVVAAAHGKRSNLDIKWKRPFAIQKANSLNNYIGIKYHVRYEHDSSTIAVHNFYNGYCGLSSIEEGKSCLCYLTTAQNLRNCGNAVEEMQRQILYKNPKLKEIFSTAEFLYDEPLAISQISFEEKSLVENHVLMTGDAAGMITPLCGNGMSMAMHSSKLLFTCMKQFLAKKATRAAIEKEYERQWKKEFSKRLWIGRNVQQFFGGNTSTSIFLKTMHSIPALAGLLIRSTHGDPF